MRTSGNIMPLFRIKIGRHVFNHLRLALFIVALIGSSTLGQISNRNLVDVYRCKGSEIPYGFVIKDVPSYSFASKLNLRIKTKVEFLGCAGHPQQHSGDNSTTEALFYVPQPYTYDFNDPETLKEIERELVTISPKGVLNIGNHFFSPENYCVKSYEPETNESTPVLTFDYCPQNCNSTTTGSRPCIKKCCVVGKSMEFTKPSNGTGHYSCKPTAGGKDWRGFLYDKDSLERIDPEIQKSALKPHYFKNNINCDFFPWVMKSGDHWTKIRSRLLSDGRLNFLGPDNKKWTTLDPNIDFCIDGLQLKKEDGSVEFAGLEEDQVALVCESESDPEESCGDWESKLYMWTLFIASGFYFLTALIYPVLWDKHNTNGWTTFSLVLARFFFCIFYGNAHRLGLEGEIRIRGSALCVGNAILGHFFILASFTWLVVINFDIWSTFRSLKPRNNGFDLLTFVWYSVFGWISPLIVVAVALILDDVYANRDTEVVTPGYGQSICLVAKYAWGYYIYDIMLVLLIATIAMSITTCWKIYRFHKGTASVKTSSNSNDTTLVVLGAKLSVVLGFSWIFEFISWIVQPSSGRQNECQHWIWITFDMYNLLTAVFIFVLFVCKWNNVKMIETKYPFMKPFASLLYRLPLIGIPKEGTSLVTKSTGPSSSSKGESAL